MTRLLTRLLTLLLALSLGGCIGGSMMLNGFKKEPCPNSQPCERK